MHMTIIAVGKIKEKFYREACSEYMKRLSRYGKLEMIEITDERCPESMSEAQMQQVKDKEGEKILARIPSGSYPVGLAIEGSKPDSVAFSALIESLGIHGESHLTWIIGGSLGLSQKVKDACKLLVSFSQMTFPHQMMRVILLEQLYRAHRIKQGAPYHKGCAGDVDMKNKKM